MFVLITTAKKFWQEFEYNVPIPADNTIPITKQDLNDLYERLGRLEALVIKPEVSNE